MRAAGSRYFPPVTNVSMGSDHTTWLAGPDEDGRRAWPD